MAAFNSHPFLTSRRCEIQAHRSSTASCSKAEFLSNSRYARAGIVTPVVIVLVPVIVL
ncbi:MAG: hypothetical protein ACOYOE_04840 [Chlorobium sp.]